MATKPQTKTHRRQSTKRIKITQLRSTIGFDRKQDAGACAGWACAGSATPWSVEDTPATRGLILKVRHLVKVEGE